MANLITNITAGQYAENVMTSVTSKLAAKIGLHHIRDRFLPISALNIMRESGRVMFNGLNGINEFDMMVRNSVRPLKTAGGVPSLGQQIKIPLYSASDNAIETDWDLTGVINPEKIREVIAYSSGLKTVPLTLDFASINELRRDQEHNQTDIFNWLLTNSLAAAAGKLLQECELDAIQYLQSIGSAAGGAGTIYPQLGATNFKNIAAINQTEDMFAGIYEDAVSGNIFLNPNEVMLLSSSHVIQKYRKFIAPYHNGSSADQKTVFDYLFKANNLYFSTLFQQNLADPGGAATSYAEIIAISKGFVGVSSYVYPFIEMAKIPELSVANQTFAHINLRDIFTANMDTNPEFPTKDVPDLLLNFVANTQQIDSIADAFNTSGYNAQINNQIVGKLGLELVFIADFVTTPGIDTGVINYRLAKV
jgi:hypothetical protein